ncbi:MAG: cation-translocating P-type ATPase [Planctomycetota bacterium]|nr:MAG: cation-translocating P-type ATPase [Planctomycetota bacterium]
MAYAEQRGAATDAAGRVVEQMTHTTGRGVRGRVDGVDVIVGSPSFVREHADRDAHDADRWLAQMESESLSPVLVAVDGRIRAAAGLRDTLRADASAALSSLRASGWKVGILSGDQRAAVAAVADELGVFDAGVHAEASPERKLETVERARSEHGAVVMVGDGVNDAAALSAADVGVAVHGGAEVSLAAADVYLSRPGLAPIVSLVRRGRRTVSVIRQGLSVSLAYNVITASLAMGGLINPLVAAILMPLSSLTVLAIALRAGGRDA